MARNKKKWQKAFNPFEVCNYIWRRLSRYITNDELYIKVKYFLSTKKILHLSNPVTFNEKIQWLKLHSDNPLYTEMVDKYLAKKYVSNLLGNDNNLIPTVGVWDRFEDIDFESLPNQFVLKTTHDSGGVVLCKDKRSFELEKAKKKLNKSLHRNYFYHTREYPYKNVKPRIIAEQYMVDESGTELKDYKFLCFNGEPKILFIATDRPLDTRFDFFDMDFNHLDMRQGHPNANKPINKPKGFEEMKRLARILSNGLSHVRIDFYDINGNVFFGEITFFHDGGNVLFEPETWDIELGKWITLPNL